jgi:hypothetical protein
MLYYVCQNITIIGKQTCLHFILPEAGINVTGFLTFETASCV